MTTDNASVPRWILIVSGFFALLEIMVSALLLFSPQSVVQSVDLSAKGVDYLVYMWAARQFALGVMFGYATLKRSFPMLTVAYVFFLVMFVGDFFIGLSQKDTAFIISAFVMSVISSAMLIALNRKKGSI